jgi:hypothetical protein
VSRWGDEIQKGVNPIVPETRITLNTGLLCQDIIVLAFKIANNLLETENSKFDGELSRGRKKLTQIRCQCCHQNRGYQQWSERCERHLPLALKMDIGGLTKESEGREWRKLTNIDRLDSNAFFDMCRVRIVRDFVSQNLGLAESVDKGRASSSRGT